VLERFDLFIITEDVTVIDETPAIGRIGLHGPESPRVLVRALGELAAAPAERVAALHEHQHLGAELAGHPVVVAGSRDIGRFGYDLYVPAAALPDVAAALSAAGAVDVDVETWDTLRIEAGRPLFGVDMDTDTIPLEAGLEARAISQTKGCYVGQEIIIRVLHRGGGRVARRLVGLVASPGGAERERPPSGGDVLRAGDREIGRVTSAAWSPRLGRFIALGYVHRDAAEPGGLVSVDLDPPLEVQVTPLPFIVPTGEAA
jgi:folate-binding protein YgfZ